MTLTENQTIQLENAIIEYFKLDVGSFQLDSGSFQIEHLDAYRDKKAVWYSYEDLNNKHHKGFCYWTASVLEDKLEDITISD